MRSVEDVAAVQELLAQGLNDCEIARRTGIPRGTVKHWRHQGPPGRTWRTRAAAYDLTTLPREPYAYLLGLYLGDGHLARHRRGVFRLGIYLDQRYPGIIESCSLAMEAIIGRAPGHNRKIGCVQVNAYSKQWPRLFPQHGPGPKHLRPIVLADWQQVIVDDHPEPFLRGLIHSDGWRGLNRVTVRGRRYAYPRYQFCNASDDIRRLFCEACDAIGVEWRRMNAMNISVARRGSVARLDLFIGPKR